MLRGAGNAGSARCAGAVYLWCACFPTITSPQPADTDISPGKQFQESVLEPGFVTKPIWVSGGAFRRWCIDFMTGQDVVAPLEHDTTRCMLMRPTDKDRLGAYAHHWPSYRTSGLIYKAIPLVFFCTSISSFISMFHPNAKQPWHLCPHWRGEAVCESTALLWSRSPRYHGLSFPTSFKGLLPDNHVWEENYVRFCDIIAFHSWHF